MRPVLQFARLFIKFVLEPATFRFAAQCLNHYATACPALLSSDVVVWNLSTMYSEGVNLLTFWKVVECAYLRTYPQEKKTVVIASMPRAGFRSTVAILDMCNVVNLRLQITGQFLSSLIPRCSCIVPVCWKEIF
jgi:hypothetical protein